MDDLGEKTVCLLGPTLGGKSSLLRTFRKCLTRDGHGYPVDAIRGFEVIDIDSEAFDAGLPDRNGKILVRFAKEAERFAQEEGYFTQTEAQRAIDKNAAGLATPINEPMPQFFFALSWTATNGHLPGRCRLQIVDSAGEISAAERRRDDLNEGILEGRRDELDDVLTQAQGLVVVVPPADGRPEPWASNLFKGLNNLIEEAPKSRRLERIVVVFSKYDQLFSWCGRDAAAWAIERETVLYVIRRELWNREWCQQLRDLIDKLGNSEPGIELVVTVASALGFTRGFGAPNHDPNPEYPSAKAHPHRFRAGKAPGGDYDSLWRPFLTGDPFVFAATGMATTYMMSAEDIWPSDGLDEAWQDAFSGMGPAQPPSSDRDRAGGVIEPQEPTERPSRVNRWLKQLRDSFDASSTD